MGALMKISLRVTFLKIILCYQLLTAIWPLMDMDSFMLVTGYKTDQWLVKTVALLLICLNATAFYCLLNNKIPVVIIVQQIAMSVALISNTYYSIKDVIPDIYLLDVPVQICSIILWILYYRKLNS